MSTQQDSTEPENDKTPVWIDEARYFEDMARQDEWKAAMATAWLQVNFPEGKELHEHDEAAGADETKPDGEMGMEVDETGETSVKNKGTDVGPAGENSEEQEEPAEVMECDEMDIS
ncbi:Protein of unknown function [Pyronema omphalodes CBS 100304]|uniref:Uncharacterized protein n=1 Tax=Pyronema omphalodes (strain CBS 100304) TaxID=1076935 RepID=U4LEL0_PYROM|nr:Protein of unknown function [Pyronema omphalodes CBS 100304]